MTKLSTWQDAKRLNMTGSGYVWIVTEQVLIPMQSGGSQGDRMSFEQNRPKCSQSIRYIYGKSTHNFYRWKSSPIIGATTQSKQSPNRRKLAQSGHPVLIPMQWGGSQGDRTSFETNRPNYSPTHFSHNQCVLYVKSKTVSQKFSPIR
jgi:hypothetical protein